MPATPAEADALARQLNLSPLIAHCLINRGITTPDAAAAFLAPQLAHLLDPAQLPDLEPAVHRIVQALARNETIGIFGDYDADGTTATALLVRFFRALGRTAPYYIPHRTTEGYGLNIAGLRALREQGATLVITVDTGSTGGPVIAQAKNELGLDIIVTDHHELTDFPNAACAVVNPKRLPDPHPLRVLCGAGVALKLLMALRARLRATPELLPHGAPNLKQWLDLVGIATIADLVPLTHDNRVLCHAGLQQLRTAPGLGVRALMDAAGITRAQLTAHQVAFRIAPRLNAAGRMAHANLAVELLTTDDPQTAQQLAAQLTQLNQDRQTQEQTMLDAADTMIRADPLWTSRSSLVIAHRDWSPGIVGIVAGRLAEHYRLPTIVIGITETLARGSARTVGAFPLLTAIQACRAHLAHCGGHDMAAGVSLTPEQIPAFQTAFEQFSQTHLTPADRQPTLRLDALLTLDQITPALCQELQQLAPFGQANPEPLFGMRGIAAQSPKIVGTKHLKFSLPTPRGPLGAIGFSMADLMPIMAQHVDLAFTIAPNEWNGVTSTQLTLRHLASTPS